MTTIGLQYLQHTEQQRHNLRTEMEQERANREQERLRNVELAEKKRSNIASEQNQIRSIEQNALNTRYSADRSSQASRYATASRSRDVLTSTTSQENINKDKLAQSQKEAELRAQTAIDTSGLNTLSGLFNTLVNAVTRRRN